MLAADRLAQLRAERQAIENAALQARLAEAQRLVYMRELGRTMAAERLTWAQMGDVVHGTYQMAPVTVPWVQFANAAEWKAYVEGVSEVWGQV